MLTRKILPIVGSFCTMAAWVALFSGGLVVGTQRYRVALNPAHSSNLPPTVEQVEAYHALVHKLEETDPSLMDGYPHAADKIQAMSQDSMEHLIKALQVRVLEPSRTVVAKPTTSPTKDANADGDVPADTKPKVGNAAELRRKADKDLVGNQSLKPVHDHEFPEWSLSRTELTFGQQCSHWFFVITCYTLTNVALLSCIASSLGFFYARSTMADSGDLQEDIGWKRFLAAFIQGFVVYLTLLAGVLVIGDRPFSSPTQTTYIRMAGIISLISFWGGYRPSYFSVVIASILPRLGSGPTDTPAPNRANSP